MKQNLNGIDRGIRLVIAALLAGGAGLAGFSSVTGVILLVLAAIMVATSAMSFCPIYALFRVSTKGPTANS